MIIFSQLNTLAKASYIRWDDNDDCLVLDQDALLDFYRTETTVCG